MRDKNNLFKGPSLLCLYPMKSPVNSIVTKKLWFGRREDPVINIDLNVDQDVFMEGLGNVLPGVLQRGKMVYQLESNRVLDSYLGLKWDERILNVAEDFAYVIPGTIKYWLGQRSPIIEYKLIGEQYARTEVENSNFITFQFVRGDGNRNNYHANR